MGEGVNIMPEIPMDVARPASGGDSPGIYLPQHQLDLCWRRAGASGERTTRPITARSNTVIADSEPAPRLIRVAAYKGSCEPKRANTGAPDEG